MVDKFFFYLFDQLKNLAREIDSKGCIDKFAVSMHFWTARYAFIHKVCIVLIAILEMDEEDFEDISDENETEVETGLRYNVCLCSLLFSIILDCSKWLFLFWWIIIFFF